MHGLLSSHQQATMEGGGMMPPNPSGPPGPYGPAPGSEMPQGPAQAAPVWMDVTPAQPQARTGVTAPKNSGLHTFGFFALIILVVGAAGFLGVAVWGPEKTVTSRARLATDPPPPMTLPSLPASADPGAASAAASAPAPAAPAAPAESAAPDPNAKPTKKNGRAKKRH